MRLKTPQLTETQIREERETRLRSFILSNLDALHDFSGETIAVLARSPASPVARAVLDLSGTLAARGVAAQIILSGGATAHENETWSFEFSADFVHEIRLTTNPRILDGHEQLVIARNALWYGDTMRRDPLKRDAFERFPTDQRDAARAARATFARLWDIAVAIYGAKSPAHVTVVKSGAETALEPRGQTPVPIVGDAGAAVTEPSAVEAATIETLEAWSPSTRH